MNNNATSTTSIPRPIEFSNTGESQENSWAFLGFIWRRLWLIVLAGVVGLGLGYLHFLQQPAQFQSASQLMVFRQRASIPTVGLQPQAYYEGIHEQLLRSPVIINQAIENHDLRSLPSFRADSNPVGRIVAGLTITARTGQTGDIITFTYSSPAAEECPRVLEAVMDAYRDFLGENQQNSSRELVDLVTTAKDVLDRQIAEVQEQYSQFREQAPLLFLGGEGRNVHETRLQQIESMRSSLQVENFQTLAKIEAIEDALKRGGSREALNLMIGQIREVGGAGTGSWRSVEDQLFPQLLEEQMLLDRFGPDHPKVTTLRRRIELVREHLLGKLRAGEETEPKDFYQVYLDSLREQIRMNEEQLASLGRLFEQESEEARKMDRFQVQDANFRAELARRERMFDAVVARLEEMSVSMDLGNIKTQVINPPGRGHQIAPVLERSLTSAAVLGLLLGVGLAFVIDSLDRRFRNPEDIHSALGLPVVGHIPEIVVKAKKRDQSGESEPAFDNILRVYHQPRGRVAEAYRSVRTALCFSTRGGGNKVIQVTSPHPGDGKTTLAANLAVTLANSEKRTLLIDADFRRPRVDKLLGVARNPGLSEEITGSVELTDAIQPLEIDNLSVLCCGQRPTNPAELVTGSQFQQLIEVLREKFEYVIIDTPPVLAVTDPLAVAPRVDGVLLVIRLGKSARKASQKALEALDSLGATVLGIVVNGVGSGRQYGGYGYSSYGYRYSPYRYRSPYGDGRYGYDYGDYGYTYGDKDSNTDATKKGNSLIRDDGSTREKSKS
jgi:capsular exopolysaccharide synthesis family protein